jgi:hypothetical protein
MKERNKTIYKIQLNANWVEAGDSDRIVRRFDSKKECNEYIRLWKEFLQDIKVTEVFWDKNSEEWIEKKVNKEMTIYGKDSVIVGNMNWYTRRIVFVDSEGKKYNWISDNAYTDYTYNDKVKINAFCRNGQYGIHLYRVKIA